MLNSLLASFHGSLFRSLSFAFADEIQVTLQTHFAHAHKRIRIRATRDSFNYFDLLPISMLMTHSL